MKRTTLFTSLTAVLAIAGCAAPKSASEAAQRADKLQASIPGAIDCSRLPARAIDLESRASANLDRAAAPIASMLNVRLHSLQAVSSLIRPGRQHKMGARFAGMVPFRVEERGIYTILVASLAWVDLSEATPPRRVEPQSFKWVTVCGTRFKSGLYALEPDRDYFLQLWDSPDRELTLITQRLR